MTGRKKGKSAEIAERAEEKKLNEHFLKSTHCRPSNTVSNDTDEIHNSIYLYTKNTSHEEKKKDLFYKVWDLRYY